MNKTIYTIASMLLLTKASMAGSTTKIVNQGDSVRIVIGDTIRVESSKNNDKVEIPIRDIVRILDGDTKVIVQDKEEKKVLVIDTEPKEKKPRTLSIGTDGGVRVSDNKKDKKRKDIVTTNYLMLDWGLNGLHDKTDYTATATQQFIRVPDANRNENLFNLRPVASMNVNLWPILVNFHAMDSDYQRVIFSSGIGIQWYNFKFTTPVSFAGDQDPHIYMNTTANFSKNKLGVSYASIPLMLTLQSKIGKSRWLTYGAGIIGGYRLTSWSKQVSKELGKVKEKDAFHMNPFQMSATAEIGVKGILRLYGTYQLTNLWSDNAAVMHPFAIGVRFLGI